MDKRPIVSLCMPTNGVIEWVFPALESIYQQGVDWGLFEVVITDNGNNKEFKKKIKDYLVTHPNIVYVEIQALPFINEIESYKRANGQLIKFVNHRALLVEGALQRFIDWAKENVEDKPIIYFANGVLKMSKEYHEFGNFDLFVRNLSYWSSWSSGMTIWKSDLDKIVENANDFNELFPHTNVLFNERKRNKYVIDNTVIFKELPQGKKPKGNYDLFGAFGIEYPGIICDLLRNGDITNETFRIVIDDNLEFIASLYVSYILKKEYCSYNLHGLDNIFGVFYTKNKLSKKITKFVIKSIVKKLIWR